MNNGADVCRRARAFSFARQVSLVCSPVLSFISHCDVPLYCNACVQRQDGRGLWFRAGNRNDAGSPVSSGLERPRPAACRHNTDRPGLPCRNCFAHNPCRLHGWYPEPRVLQQLARYAGDPKRLLTADLFYKRLEEQPRAPEGTCCPCGGMQQAMECFVVCAEDAVGLERVGHVVAGVHAAADEVFESGRLKRVFAVGLPFRRGCLSVECCLGAWLLGCSSAHLFVHPASWFVCSLACWLAGCLAAWLPGCLARWLAGSLARMPFVYVFLALALPCIVRLRASTVCITCNEASLHRGVLQEALNLSNAINESRKNGNAAGCVGAVDGL